MWGSTIRMVHEQLLDVGRLQFPFAKCNILHRVVSEEWLIFKVKSMVHVPPSSWVLFYHTHPIFSFPQIIFFSLFILYINNKYLKYIYDFIFFLNHYIYIWNNFLYKKKINDSIYKYLFYHVLKAFLGLK